MNGPRHIEDLADELLLGILSFLSQSDPLIYGAPHTSVALGLPLEANGYGERTNLDRFRLVNKRFMRIGTPRKFSRLAVRFSTEGFNRLEEFLDMQLACYVQHFTYMVRPFYQGSGWPQIVNGVDTEDLPISVLRSRLEDQSSIKATNRDLSLLQRAFASFKSLQRVKLLRLQDEAEMQLKGYIHGSPLEETVSLDWEATYTRAITNLGIALSKSDCKPIQFTTPHTPSIDAETATRLLQAPSTLRSAIGARLTSLDIKFYPQAYTAANLKTLSNSNVFHDFFLATTNLRSIHLGFPSLQPLDLPLETIIHPTIQWKRLHTFSLEGWILSAKEINAFARRHSHLLREIRLHSICLDGGRWKDVLAVLHDEMKALKRVELRGIDYSRRFYQGLAHGHDHNHDNGADELELDPGSEQLRSLTIDDLGDDGIGVKPGQDRFWEAWVMG